METDVGPWDFLSGQGNKGNATLVQKSIVPWCISLYGLNYHKNVTLEVIKEMVLALCDMNGYRVRKRRKSITSLSPTSPSK